MPASEARIQANRANARRSSGPKTAEGKARSRANALKHGMAGSGVVLPEDDRARWEHRAAAWAQELDAEDESGRFLAGRAALASVRLDRCVRAETAVLEERRALALEKWGVDRERRAQITHHAERWAHEPAETVAGLEATARGCEWLLAFWEYLAGLLRADGFWDQRHTARIVNLVGVHDPELTTLLWKCSLAQTADLNDPADLDWAEDVLKVADRDGDVMTRRASIAATLPGRAEARESITAICQSEQARLQARQQRLWENGDGPRRERALAIAAFDDSETATLRRRYETASTSDLHRALNQIHVNNRAREGGRPEPEPEPDPSTGLRNEPNGAGDLAPEALESASVVADSPGPSDCEREPEPTPISDAPAACEAVAAAPLRNEQSWPSEGPPYPMKVRACTLPPTRGLSEEPNHEAPGASQEAAPGLAGGTFTAHEPLACDPTGSPGGEDAARVEPAPH